MKPYWGAALHSCQEKQLSLWMTLVNDFGSCEVMTVCKTGMCMQGVSPWWGECQREDCAPQTVGAGDTREDHKQSGIEFVSRLAILSTFLKALQTFGILWERLIDNTLTVPTAKETGLLCETATVPGLHMATNTCGVATSPGEWAQKTPSRDETHRAASLQWGPCSSTQWAEPLHGHVGTRGGHLI